MKIQKPDNYGKYTFYFNDNYLDQREIITNNYQSLNDFDFKKSLNKFDSSVTDYQNVRETLIKCIDNEKKLSLD